MANPLRAKSVRIQWSEIEEFKEMVESLPAIPVSLPTTASARQTIEALYDSLIFLRRERNYGYDDLANHLEQTLNLKLSPLTVKSYIDLAGRKRRKAISKASDIWFLTPTKPWEVQVLKRVHRACRVRRIGQRQSPFLRSRCLLVQCLRGTLFPHHFCTSG